MIGNVEEEDDMRSSYGFFCTNVMFILAGYHTIATGNQQYMFHAIVGSALSSLGAYCLYSA